MHATLLMCGIEEVARLLEERRTLIRGREAALAKSLQQNNKQRCSHFTPHPLQYLDAWNSFERMSSRNCPSTLLWQTVKIKDIRQVSASLLFSYGGSCTWPSPRARANTCDALHSPLTSHSRSTRGIASGEVAETVLAWQPSTVAPRFTSRSVRIMRRTGFNRRAACNWMSVLSHTSIIFVPSLTCHLKFCPASHSAKCFVLLHLYAPVL